MRTQVLAFDIYGTLLDTSSVARSLSEHLNLDDKKAEEVGKVWRLHQLEYTWRLNSMGFYEPWNRITHKSLLHALGECGLASLVPQYDLPLRRDENATQNIAHDLMQDKLRNDIEKVLKKYYTLESFSDAHSSLTALKSMEGVKTMVFSNGTELMISNALKAASLDNLLTNESTIFVADKVMTFKPSFKIYRALVRHVRGSFAAELPNSNTDVWLVSGNPFDVIGARSQGLKVIWVDRAGKGWNDRLGDGLGGPIPMPDTITTPPMELSEIPTNLGPTKIVRGLNDIPEVMKDVLANGVKPGEGGFDRPLIDVDNLDKLFRTIPPRMYDV